jgi:hypothetical protein
LRVAERSSQGAPLDPEAEYYQSIEEFFVSRRGDPLFLSSADWLLVRKWRRALLPLRIVLRGIADALESHRHSWSRHQKVASLAYCEAEVEQARDRWQRALSLGAEPGLDVSAILEHLAAALERASLPEKGAGRLSRGIAAALRELAQAPPPPSEVEARLLETEARLARALERLLGEAGLAELGQAVDADLEAYRSRMPVSVYAQVRRESLRRRLLARFGLPRLSLFHHQGGAT